MVQNVTSPKRATSKRAGTEKLARHTPSDQTTRKVKTKTEYRGKKVGSAETRSISTSTGVRLGGVGVALPVRSQVNDRSTFTKFYKEAEPPEHLDPGEMADFRSQMCKVKTVSKRCAMTRDTYQANDLSANVGISLEYVDQGGTAALLCIYSRQFLHSVLSTTCHRQASLSHMYDCKSYVCMPLVPLSSPFTSSLDLLNTLKLTKVSPVRPYLSNARNHNRQPMPTWDL